MRNIAFAAFYYLKSLQQKHFFRNRSVAALLFFLFLFFDGGIYAQSVKVSLNYKKTALETVLNDIEKQTNYLFIYKDEIDVKRQITIHAKSKPLSQILNELLKGTRITYKVDGQHIMLISVKKDKQTRNEKQISGEVTDSSGEPLIGVTIKVKGFDQGTITDFNGHFSIDAQPGDILLLSYIGYTPQEMTIGDNTTIKAVLKEDVKALDEVVVVGYGVQKKVNLTGSIGTIKPDKVLKARAVTNVQELMAGAVPGLTISKSSGAVGSGASINIHGTSTIGSSSGVLVLIDGMPGNLYTLNPNDIESISVLKDAASAAIYGSRAANGVMLVTTKTGQASKRPTVELSTSVGLQQPQFKLDFVGAEDYMRLYDEAMVNDGKNTFYGEEGLQDLKTGKYADNKWYKEIYQKNTLINNVHMSISGKEKAITYRFSLSNDYQQGSLPNNQYNRLIFKPDLKFRLLDNLNASVNIQYTQTNITNPQGGTEYYQSQASRISPITPIYTVNGQYGTGSSMAGNPIAGVNEGGYSKERHKEMMAIFSSTYTPLPNWNIKATIAAYTHDQTTKDRVNTYYLYDDEGNVAKTQNLVSSFKESNSYSYRTQLQFTSDYSFTVNDNHHVKLLAGYSQEYHKSEGFWASRDNLPFDGIDVLGVGSDNKQNGDTGSGPYDVAIQSWFGRANYDYKGKYLFEASIRADGSSRFAKGHRWGIFPSVSAGWNIHREKFMEAASSWLSELKIRGSYGTLGDADKVGYYPTAQVLDYNPKIYTFNGKLAGGAYNNVAINENITWEVSQMGDIGIDLGLLDQHIRLSVDYFNNLRHHILYRPPVPSEFGLSAPVSNLLRMRNQGMDLSASYNDSRNFFTWGIDLNASFSKNKVLEMGESDKWIEGNSVTYLNGQYQLPYGYEAEGLFQNEQEIKEHAKQNNVLPGNFKFKDQDGNGIIDGDDRIILNDKLPIGYGLNLHFGYKALDFSMNMYGKLNTKRYLSGYEGWAFYLSQNARPMHLDAWSTTNTNATYPRLTLTNTANDTQYNSFWLRKANYLKIQNIQVGYTLPDTALEKVGIKYLRLYLSCQNLATITGYDGFDPEGGWYPLSRTFSFGFNLQF